MTWYAQVVKAKTLAAYVFVRENTIYVDSKQKIYKNMLTPKQDKPVDVTSFCSSFEEEFTNQTPGKNQW